MFKSVKAENLYSVEEEQQKIIDHMNKVQLARGEKKKKFNLCMLGLWIWSAKIIKVRMLHWVAGITVSQCTATNLTVHSTDQSQLWKDM